MSRRRSMTRPNASASSRSTMSPQPVADDDKKSARGEKQPYIPMRVDVRQVKWFVTEESRNNQRAPE